MRLSNKSTFSLVCLVLLFALVTVPAMANTMSAVWSEDLDTTAADNQPGWMVTLTYATAPTAANAPTASDVTVTPSGFATIESFAPTTGTTPAVTDTTTVFTFNVQLATANQADNANITLADHRRVTLTNGQSLASTSIYLPKLKSIMAPKSARQFALLDVIIEFEAPAAPVTGPPAVPGIGPAIGLTRADVAATAGTVQSVTPDGVNKYKAVVAMAGSTTTISVTATAFPFQARAGTDPVIEGANPTIVFDETDPTISTVALESTTEFDLPAYPAELNENFRVVVTATDEPAEAANFDLDYAVTTSMPDRVDVMLLGKKNGLPVFEIVLKPNTTTTDWPVADLMITVTVTDIAGNSAEHRSTRVKLAARDGVESIPNRAPAFASDASISDITATAGTAITSVTLPAATDPDSGDTLTYSITPAVGNGLMFDAATRVLSGTPTAMMAQTSYTYTVTDSGSLTDTLTFNITVMDAMVDPTVTEFTIDADSFVVVVRDMDAGHATALRAHKSDIVFHEWAGMPDLQNVFDTNAVTGGGALILEQAGDSAAMGYVARTPGTVGISEVMWAIDQSQLGNAAMQRANQWIEIHNLNVDTTDDATPGTDDGSVMVKLSWKTGATAISTDTTINGDLSNPKLDVVTNVFNDRPGTTFWVLPGQNGNPNSGVNFASMARVPKRGAFSIDRRHENNAGKARDGLYTRFGGGDANGANQSLDGRKSGSWTASTTAYARLSTNLGIGLGTVVYDFLGTPGRVNTFSPERATVRDSRTDINPTHLIINEVSNRDDVNNQYEWIELRNIHATEEVNLNNYQISILTGVGKDEPFIFLPNNNNSKIPAGGVLLLVDSDPFEDDDHPLAVGWKIGKNPEDQVPGLAGLGIDATSKHGRYLVVPFGGKNNKFTTGLPDDGNFILVVRRPDNHEGDHGNGGKGRADLPTDKNSGDRDLDKIVDIAGYVGGLNTGLGYKNAVSQTNLWPLKQQGGPDDKNRLTANKVRRRQHVSTRDGRAGTGNTHNDRGAGHIAFRDVGYSGIGYKRKATNSAIHGGTPGYDNGVQKGSARDADIGTAKLVISEMMLSQGSENARTKLPQWIEIYNPSPHPIGIGGWSLVIENPRDPIRRLYFGNGTVKTILPEQTILIVSGSARDFGSDTLPATTVFPTTRVYNVYQHQKNDFDMDNRTDPIITDTTQFRITLIDGAALDTSKADQQPDVEGGKHLKVSGKYYTISDDVGNLDGNARTNDVAMWMYPDGMTEDDDRTSLIRVFDNGVPREGVSMDVSNVKPLGGTDGVGVDGMNGIDMKYSWVHASDTDFAYAGIFVAHTWYGAKTDSGSPLNRIGQILPVELSSFRPTLQDGKVTIRWTTESELDNAGFNILRSEERNGEYKQVNTDLIQGAGTTGEKTTYSWVDATAKPGVEYYYQIEDVSFAGEHQVLAMTKLKGLISAENKLTTTWGELKEVQ